MSGGRTIVDAIDKLADDPRIRAIVLRIDSPGGAVMASDQIWRAVQRARAKKPVIASMGERGGQRRLLRGGRRQARSGPLRRPSRAPSASSTARSTSLRWPKLRRRHRVRDSAAPTREPTASFVPSPTKSAPRSPTSCASGTGSSSSRVAEGRKMSVEQVDAAGARARVQRRRRQGAEPGRSPRWLWLSARARARPRRAHRRCRGRDRAQAAFRPARLRVCFARAKCAGASRPGASQAVPSAARTS